MERVNIICIGKLKEKYLREMSAEYEKRLSRYCRLSITELAESYIPENAGGADVERALEKEYRAMSGTAGDGYRIAMCIEGEQKTSPELAKIMEKGMSGSGTVTFFIGSSHGMSERLKSECDLRLSMSELTFPHQLARCMLLEQIYRSYKIRKKENYHK